MLWLRSFNANGAALPNALHGWLIQDLVANAKPVVLVFGHEPAYPQPDADTGRLRYQNDSLNVHPQNRDRFWQTLNTHGVTAYICGHTHNYSAGRLRSVGSIDPSGSGDAWQIDSGHARGTVNTGSPGTGGPADYSVSRTFFWMVITVFALPPNIVLGWIAIPSSGMGNCPLRGIMYMSPDFIGLIFSFCS